MGKSTFAAALAEYYSNKGKIVKTIEAPRDLVLPPEITQLAISHGSSSEVHDILLLSRPDYTLFDEMRNLNDFNLFSDLRLSGIGLAGVIHATKPIDAIQRFVGKIELGVIPHVVDTVIFIKNGTVDKVLSLQMEVKVPFGMTESDLARPVITVKDFEKGKLEYELYSYGEETVVIPIKDVKTKASGALKLAEEPIKDEFYKYTDNCEVDVISENKAIVKVPEYSIAGIIGKAGKHIEQIEKNLGISIEIEELQGSFSKKDKKKKRKGKF
jgi:ATPase